MRPASALLLLAALLLGSSLPLANVPNGGAARAAPAAAGARQMIPIDSLRFEDKPRFKLYASDLNSLQLARRDLTHAAETFRRYITEYPPVIGVAVLGSLDDPARVDHAELRAAGATYIADDWPEHVHPGAPPAPPVMPLTERAGRWFLHEYEIQNAHAAAPAGRTRLIPAWFESAMGGLCLPFADENQRVAVIRNRMAERIPILTLFSMERPSGKTPPARAGRKARGAALPRAVDPEIFDAEALAFAKFVSDREQPNIVGGILDAYLSGQPELFAINNAKNLMARPDTLEKAFFQWLQSPPGRPSR